MRIYSEKDANNIVLEIADTGQGIPADVKPNIFDPFFTTKGPGKGTGLGLSIAHLIVKRHHGTISMESEIDKGTKFTIKLLPGERSKKAS